jgi:hypothetical protein
MSKETPNLSESDLKLLLDALANSSLAGKKKGMSMEYKNALLQKLSATANSDTTTPQKPTSEMNEQERKEHREALRRKLHEKTSTLQTSRGSKVLKNKLYENSLSKLNLGGNVAPQMPLEQEEEQQEQQQQQEQLAEFLNE